MLPRSHFVIYLSTLRHSIVTVQKRNSQWKLLQLTVGLRSFCLKFSFVRINIRIILADLMPHMLLPLIKMIFRFIISVISLPFPVYACPTKLFKDLIKEQANSIIEVIGAITHGKYGVIKVLENSLIPILLQLLDPSPEGLSIVTWVTFVMGCYKYNVNFIFVCPKCTFIEVFKIYYVYRFKCR